ncbi:hypothetical protein ED312_10465 [Sinomicrobium pectinilyticum]|uniref:DUF2938 family protein n=1 Tax=Sinomicrobium pectinilyticum TaxID=1084421 RepID=A0A3N0EH71_SINP1|nr:hypothetical protein [Sinomicrobium pectinilyticum]RNL87225.1 hypothetical protein ED312_10465 [Sinomicrobium pectinilyticum]
MNIFELIITAIVSTSVMTLFSYRYARARSSQFKEPELLNLLVKNSGIIPLSPSKKNILGWILHYAIGFFFVLIFEILLSTGIVDFSLVICVVYGIVIGVIGVCSWLFMFSLNNDPPKIRFSEFYVHLLLAHLFFAVSMGLMYILIASITNNTVIIMR